ncbi:hypothetical protein TNCT_481191 [Trichonephila clavata]|uniref:Uncharacterized protein n=1 Tax=Trichonephila clavata TaxID=2740835 RepID=A0A8X6FBA8_TRICU|nr:hypothetical protein TNCT_481191 [Trichonephila clavata]
MVANIRIFQTGIDLICWCAMCDNGKCLSKITSKHNSCSTRYCKAARKSCNVLSRAQKAFLCLMVASSQTGFENTPLSCALGDITSGTV